MGDGDSPTSGKLGECVINMEEKSSDRESPTSGKVDVGEWVIKMKEKLSLMEAREKKEVPVRKQEERLRKFYTCGLFTDGHEFVKPDRVSMRRDTEEKKESLVHFLRRTNRELDCYLNALSQVSDKLKEAWEGLGYPWEFDDSQHFVQMMLLNGAFLLEFMHAKELYFWGIHQGSRVYAAALDNPVMGLIFEDHDETKRYLRDFLLIGNQLPLMVLDRLIMASHSSAKDTELRRTLLMDIAVTFLRIYHVPGIEHMDSEFKGSLHILDVCRRFLVRRDFKRAKTKRRKSQEFMSNIPSATALHSVGIRFTTSRGINMLHVRLRGKTLMLPEIVIDGSTRSLFFNLITFEKLHKNVAESEVASYLYLMRCLVIVADDASLLQSCGIIVTTLPPADVADLFNKMIKDISFDPDDPDLFYRETREYYSIPSDSLAPEIIETFTMVRARYKKMTAEWRKDLFQTYLKSPWAIMSVVAAILLFTLSFIQTVYTVLGYVHPK